MAIKKKEEIERWDADFNSSCMFTENDNANYLRIQAAKHSIYGVYIHKSDILELSEALRMFHNQMNGEGNE